MDARVWLSRFAEHMEARNWSWRTVAGYTSALRRFFDFLSSQGVKSVADISRDVVLEFRDFLHHLMCRRSGGHLAMRTQALNLCAVKSFCRFLAHEHFVLLDPAVTVEIPKVPDTLPRVLLSEEEVLRLLHAPDVTEPLGVRDRALIELLYCSGMRSSELCGLTCEDVDLAELEAHVVEGKGSKGRRVPLGEEAALWIGLYKTKVRPKMSRLETDVLFLNRRGKPMDREALTLLVSQAGQNAGLAHRVTPHLLRHAFATHLLECGADFYDVQHLLGHRAPQSTEIYTHVTKDVFSRKLRACHSRGQRITKRQPRLKGGDT